VTRVDEVKLEEFSIPELEELGERVAKQIEVKREKLKQLAFEEIEQLAEKHGLTLKEVLQAGHKPRKRQPPKQKYRNPDKPSQTWSGRGKKPGWVEKALEQGKSLKDLQI
jgi:DNA-binding protein H-NS